jgi:hypothetical protein
MNINTQAMSESKTLADLVSMQDETIALASRGM